MWEDIIIINTDESKLLFATHSMVPKPFQECDMQVE